MYDDDEFVMAYDGSPCEDDIHTSYALPMVTTSRGACMCCEPPYLIWLPSPL